MKHFTDACFIEFLYMSHRLYIAPYSAHLGNELRKRMGEKKIECYVSEHICHLILIYKKLVAI